MGVLAYGEGWWSPVEVTVVFRDILTRLINTALKQQPMLRW